MAIRPGNVAGEVNEVLNFLTNQNLLEAERRRKKNLTQEELERQREKEARQAKLKLLLSGRLGGEQEKSVLSEFGIQPQKDVGGELRQEALGLGTTTLSPEERGIAQEELSREAQLRQLQQLGIGGRELLQGAGEGTIQNEALRELGLGISPETSAKVGTEQTRGRANLALERQRLAAAQAQEELGKLRKAKAKELDKAGNPNASNKDRRQALEKLADLTIQEMKTLETQIISGDEEARNRQAELRKQLFEIRKELRNVGGIEEKEQPKSGVANRITTLKTMLRKNLIDPGKYQKLIKQAFENGAITREQAIKALSQ